MRPGWSLGLICRGAEYQHRIGRRGAEPFDDRLLVETALIGDVDKVSYRCPAAVDVHQGSAAARPSGQAR